MSSPDLATLRVEYESTGLSRSQMADDPFDEFSRWFSEAVGAGVQQANAFVLATASAAGRPSARAVLMKDYSAEGIVFYTNASSRKGRELGENPHAAACFVWMDLHRQIRLEGPVEAVEPAIADAYFASRPPGSRLAAAASSQSAVVADRSALEARWDQLAAAFPDGDVPRPESWGGFRIRPVTFEFWQGRPNRFHDRIRYRLADGHWVIERLAP